MSGKRTEFYKTMTKTNLRIAVISVGKWKGRKDKWLDFFSAKLYIGKNKTKPNMAKTSICQIWVLVNKYQHIYNFK